MEKSKYEEAKGLMEIIRACEYILDDADGELSEVFNESIKARDPFGHILGLLSTSRQVQRSFLRWVRNEKEIATQKFKEL